MIIKSKTILASTFCLGLFGISTFLMKWEYFLAVCEALCLTGIVWLMFRKYILVRSLPFFIIVITLGALMCSYGAIQIWTGWLWPPDNGCWDSVIRSPEGLPKIAINLIFRPHTPFWTIVDELTGLCLAALLLPVVRHLTER